MGEVELVAGAAAALEHAVEVGRLVDHRHGVAEHDLGLILVDGGGVDLGARLTVGGQHVEADASRERRLAVALADLDEGDAKAPIAVAALPAEQAADDERLERLKRELAALVLATI